MENLLADQHSATQWWNTRTTRARGLVSRMRVGLASLSGSEGFHQLPDPDGTLYQIAGMGVSLVPVAIEQCVVTDSREHERDLPTEVHRISKTTFYGSAAQQSAGTHD